MTNPIRRIASRANERNRIMESWMSGYGTGVSSGGEAPDHWSPATDVLMQESGDLMILMELPDIRRDNIQVSLTGGDLTVSGHREARGEEGSQYFTSERYTGPFQRTISLPDGLTKDRISCHFERGTLEITIQGYADTLEAESQRLEVLGPGD